MLNRLQHSIDETTGAALPPDLIIMERRTAKISRKRRAALSKDDLTEVVLIAHQTPIIKRN